MDNPEILLAGGDTGPEGSLPMDQESLARRLCEVDDKLESNRVQFNELIEKLNQSIRNCHRADICKLDDRVICMKFAARVNKINTRLAIYRQSMFEMRTRVAMIDRRRTVNDKLSHERQALARAIVKTQEKFENQERQLRNERFVVDQLRARFRTDTARDTREVTFAMAASLKRHRHTLTTERNKLLELQEALRNEH